MILGPALGGVIYGLWGIKMVFYINGFSFLISAVFSFFISYNRKAVEKEKMNIGMFSQGAIPVGSLVFGILLDTMKYYNLLIMVNLAAILAAAVFLTRACDEAYEVKALT